MRLREIQGLDHTESLEDLVANGLLITARTDEEFLEMFGMVEMIAKCQELSVDRGSIARFFVSVGHALYVNRQGSECSVQYGQNIQFPIAKQEHLPTPTVSAVGSCVSVTDADKNDNPDDPGPSHEPQHKRPVELTVHATTIAPQVICTFEEREVQTDLDCDVQLPVICSNCHVPQLERDAALYIDYVHLAMPPVSVGLQSDSDIVHRPSKDSNCTYTVGRPSQGEPFIDSSSHVSELGSLGDMDIDDGRPPTHIVPMDLHSDSDAVLWSADDTHHTYTVSSPMPGESRITCSSQCPDSNRHVHG